MAGETVLKNSVKYGLTLLSSVFIPGSGYVYLGIPTRGLMMLMWMFAFAFITYQVTQPDLSFLWRISGGLFVWVISLIDIARRARTRWSKSKLSG